MVAAQRALPPPPASDAAATAALAERLREILRETHDEYNQEQLEREQQQRLDMTKSRSAAAAAERRQRRARKPHRYWSDQRNVVRELHAFLRTSSDGDAGVTRTMPTKRELERAGRVDLSRAVLRRGGFARVAQAAGLRTQRRRRGYWSGDLERVCRALREYVSQRQGCGAASTACGEHAVAMPTHAELVAAGRGALAHAVAQHGGYAEVAAVLGWRAARRRRDWKQPSVLARELVAFATRAPRCEKEAAERPAPAMPRRRELIAAGRFDLDNAIRAHGGYVAVGAKLGMRRTSSHRSRSHGYWNDIGHLDAELRAFVANARRNGTGAGAGAATTTTTVATRHNRTNGAATMPRQRELAAAGRTDLMHAVRRHGGYAAVAIKLGLSPATERRAKGYWCSFDNLRFELDAFVNENCYPGMMPRLESLKSSGRNDLVYAIWKHGGPAAVAGRLRLFWFGPSTFWRSFGNLRRRLRAYMNARQHKRADGAGARSDARLMPLQEQLVRAGRYDLVFGISLHGGISAVAQRMRLCVRDPPRPPFYWESAQNIERELRQFLSLALPGEAWQRGYMPTSSMILKAGRRDLAAAIRRHGGWERFSRRLGLKPAFERRRRGYWNEFSNVRSELLTYVQHLQCFCHAVREESARSSEHETEWWRRPRRPLSPLRDDDDGGDEGSASPSSRAAATATAIVMPTAAELRLDGRGDLLFACQRIHGGLDAVAQRLGWRCAETAKRELLDAMNSSFAALRRELLHAWMPKYGATGEMPTRHDLERTARHDLHQAIVTHGGYSAVASRLKLLYGKP